MGPVEGRKDDAIVTADGRIMPRAGLDQIHEFVDNLERCQLVQEKLGEVVVRVLPRPGFGSADASELIRQLEKRLGKSTLVRIEIVDRLDLTILGKERFIVSRLNLDRLTGIPLDVRDGDVRRSKIEHSDVPRNAVRNDARHSESQPVPMKPLL